MIVFPATVLDVANEPVLVLDPVSLSHWSTGRTGADLDIDEGTPT